MLFKIYHKAKSKVLTLINMLILIEFFVYYFMHMCVEEADAHILDGTIIFQHILDYYQHIHTALTLFYRAHFKAYSQI